MTCNKLFVYGTLLNVNILKKRWEIIPTDIKKANIKGSLYRAGWFPIYIDEGEDIIFGKLFTIENLNNFLLELDYYENCIDNDPNSLYHREIKEIILENNEKNKGWVYRRKPNSKW